MLRDAEDVVPYNARLWAVGFSSIFAQSARRGLAQWFAMVFGQSRTPVPTIIRVNLRRALPSPAGEGGPLAVDEESFAVL